MRSQIRMLMMLAALAAPLAALAADGSPLSTRSEESPAPSARPRTDPSAHHRPEHARRTKGDRLNELAGQNGVPNSFDSP